MKKKIIILKIVSGTIFCCIGLFLLVDNFTPINKANYIFEECELQTVTGYLINDPKYHQSSGKTGGSYFKVELNTYPGLNFQNEGVFLKATQWHSIMADVKYQDTVSLKVLKFEFDKNYINIDSMNLLQKIAAYPFDKFQFYSFTFKDKEYISNLYETAKEHQRENSFFQFFFGLMFLGMGIYSFMTKK